MSYTKKDRKYYNEQRERSCKRLGITKNDYNWYRRKGEALRKVFENDCNGLYIEDEFENACRPLEKLIRARASKQELCLYIQRDCRGASVYLDKVVIPANNYNQAVCIY